MIYSIYLKCLISGLIHSVIIANLTKKYFLIFFSFPFSSVKILFQSSFSILNARCLASRTSWKLPSRKDQNSRLRIELMHFAFHVDSWCPSSKFLSSCVYVLRVIISNFLLSVNTCNYIITMCGYAIMMYD